MRYGCAVVLLLVVLAPVAAFAQTGRPEALIGNGGFEDGFEGWKPDSKYELVTDPKLAHGAQNCVTGEVTEPNTHLTLSRAFDLRVGVLYTLTVWAKGTNRTKIAVWRTTEAGDRKNVAQWQDQRPKWRPNQATFTVETSGEWTIDLIAPSSHGAPPGRIWIDDVQLAALDVPEPVAVSGGQGFNDFVRIVPMGDGLCFAWISFRDGADTLQVARASLSGQVERTWQVVGGEGTYVLDPYVVPDGDDAWLLYSSEVNGDWEIFTARITASGPDDPVRATRALGADIRPTGAIYGGNLWLVWEATRKRNRRIIAAELRDGGGIGRERAFAPPNSSNYEPDAAVAEGGPLTVVWTSYQNGNSDILLARFDGEGWSKPERLTSAPTLDRHPVLCPSGEDLWLAWENANSGGYHIGNNKSRRLAVAKLTAEGPMSPVALKTSPLWQRAESAALALDDVGRLWVAYLKPRSRNDGWDIYIHCLAGSKCSPAYRVTSMKGMDRPISLVARGDRLIVGFQADDIPRGWQSIETATEGDTTSAAYLASLDISGAPQPAPLELEPYADPEDVYEAAEIRVARGEDQPTRSITYQGESYKLYFGDLHEHTEVSVCNRTGDQSINESYQSMRDIARYDFACATDHGYNINPYLWNYTAKLARANEDAGRFLTFLAEEWTSSIEEYSDKYPEGYYGHRNVIFEDPYWPRWYNSRSKQTPKELWRQLADEDASAVTIPHQLADTGNVPCDWEQVNEAAQPVAEIFQTRGSYEYEGTPRQAKRTLTGNFIHDAWAKGVVIGIIAAPDHGGGMGKAAVFASELTREAILDAIRRRHTYGTTAAKIFLDARVEGRLMGEKVARTGTGPVTVEVNVVCPQDIKRVDICRNNEFIYTREGNGRVDKFTYRDTDPVDGLSYYYVRVIQADDEIAWSSPVWLQPG